MGRDGVLLIFDSDENEEGIMMPFEKCPVCGGEMVEKEVDKLLRGGVNTAIMRVSAEVCLRCGERLYSTDVVRCFESIREKLKMDETAEFRHIGKSFQVGTCDLERIG
jgi:YgiT-type zinc finger domain-containing protein